MAASVIKSALLAFFSPLDRRAWSRRGRRLLRGIYFYILNRTFDDPKLAHWICKLVPAQCPFERDVLVLGWEFHIPALCKLNPFYEQLVALRFKALSYLSEDCGEDILPYCQ
jgi:hypothetical protein